jgi:hypothetical protein
MSAAEVTAVGLTKMLGQTSYFIQLLARGQLQTRSLGQLSCTAYRRPVF